MRYTVLKKNPIYVFPEKELRGLSTNSYIYVSVSDLYIPRIGPHKYLAAAKYTDGPGNISISHRYMSVGIRRKHITILFWK